MATHLFTIDEATKALGISRSTLWRLRRRLRAVCLRNCQKAGNANITSEIPPFTEDHPIFRLVGAGRGAGNPVPVTNTRS